MYFWNSSKRPLGIVPTFSRFSHIRAFLILKVTHEFVNLLKIGRRVGPKKMGDIEGLFDNRVKTNDDHCNSH